MKSSNRMAARPPRISLAGREAFDFALDAMAFKKALFAKLTDNTILEDFAPNQTRCEVCVHELRNGGEDGA